MKIDGAAVGSNVGFAVGDNVGLAVGDLVANTSSSSMQLPEELGRIRMARAGMSVENSKQSRPCVDLVIDPTLVQAAEAGSANVSVVLTSKAIWS